MINKNKYINSRIISIQFIYYFIIIVLGIVLFNKCKYSMPKYDEQIYLAMTKRFAYGDCFIVDEWMPAQLFAFIMIPLFKLYCLIMNTEGIFLAFRFLYMILLFVTGILIYNWLKPINEQGAAVGSLIYMCYTPFYITALSYNTIAIITLVICLALLQTKINKKKLIICGILFAFAVLCCPYLILLWFMYLFLVLMTIKKKEKYELLELINCFWINLGCGIILCVFMPFLLKQGFQPLVNSLHELVTFKDSYNQNVKASLFYKFRLWYNYIINSGDNKSAFSFFLLTVIVFVTAVLQKNNQIKRNYLYLYLLSITFITIWLSVFLKKEVIYINYLMLPLSFFAPICVLLTNRSDVKKLFYLFWIPGVIYSYCLNLSSDQNYYAISSAMVVPLISSVIMMFCSMQEIVSNEIKDKIKKDTQWIVGVITVCVMFVVITLNVFFLIKVRINVFYGDGLKSEFTEQIDKGPFKGIYVKPGEKKEYETELEVLNILKSSLNKDDSFLWLSGQGWHYVYINAKCGGESVCTSFAFDENTINRHKRYYNSHPNKIPKIIYSNSQYKEINEWFVNNYSYSVFKLDDENIFLKRK